MAKQEWALVTGASSGIGREFAQLFAEAGTNLVLVARTKDVLENVAHELTTKYDVKVLVFPGDLSQQNIVKELVQFVANKKITVEYLINNAGFGDFGYFVETNWDKE